jgi:putative nucleotidyltransferase with HDIG domain
MFPIPAFGLLVSLLFSIESGIIFSLILGLLTAYGLPTALDLIPFYILSSILGVLVLGKARRVGHFLWAAGAIAGAGAAVIAAFRLPFTSTDWLGITMLVGAAVFNGIASTSLALLLQYILAQILGMTTALQLLEISRPDYPLLQMYLRKAPGTYQHSLQVMNLAEQAAESIGADSLLVRVGAIYHDIGKTANAAFFVENQVPGDLNTHDDMDPIEAAEAIILHVTDGVKITQKHRLPRQIIDFISEHHGTLITRYQFNRALEATGNDREKVDPEQFRYPGPKPQSRETALVMFADGVEARTRAERPKSEQELVILVRTVIERCQKEGQLEDTPLTQKDLKAIGESFVKILRGTFHPRVKYPKEQMDIPTTPIGD